MIIALSGKARSGKDTIGDYLVKHHGFVKMSFAQPLKQMVHDLFGISWADLGKNPTGEKTKEARKLLQIVGTDIVREVKDDYWVSIFANRVQLRIDKGHNVVVNDMRFQNEFDWFFGKNGSEPTIRVVRTDKKSKDNHITETELDNVKHDYTIKAKSGDLESLYKQIEAILKEVNNAKDTD